MARRSNTLPQTTSNLIKGTLSFLKCHPAIHCGHLLGRGAPSCTSLCTFAILQFPLPSSPQKQTRFLSWSHTEQSGPCLPCLAAYLIHTQDQRARFLPNKGFPSKDLLREILRPVIKITVLPWVANGLNHFAQGSWPRRGEWDNECRSPCL